MVDVLQYLEDHLEESLNIKLLADMAGYSEYHFIRKFKSYTNETVMEYKRTDYVEPDQLITQSAGKTVEEMLLGKESAREVHIILHELKEP
ncbi:MAG: helix-turn-helix transcriptional regulator [Eubacteriales bacterium]|nr:helix-turn-helix transcriptional regulator [Eubacteriales bacterium]